MRKNDIGKLPRKVVLIASFEVSPLIWSGTKDNLTCPMQWRLTKICGNAQFVDYRKQGDWSGKQTNKNFHHFFQTNIFTNYIQGSSEAKSSGNWPCWVYYLWSPSQGWKFLAKTYVIQTPCSLYKKINLLPFINLLPCFPQNHRKVGFGGVGWLIKNISLFVRVCFPFSLRSCHHCRTFATVGRVIV